MNKVGSGSPTKPHRTNRGSVKGMVAFCVASLLFINITKVRLWHREVAIVARQQINSLSFASLLHSVGEQSRSAHLLSSPGSI